MADNVTVDNGDLTDYEVVTDEITSPYTGGTKQAQAVKILSGTANANDVIPGDATNGLDVDVTRVQGSVAVTNAGLTELAAAIDTEVQVDVVGPLPAGNNNIGEVDVASSALPTGASTLAEQQTQTASLSVLDDWDESDRAKVNPIVGQAGVAAGAGAVSATVQRVTLASDDPAVASLAALDNAIAGNELQVDVVTMPTVAVTQSGAWDEVGINDSGNSITVDAPVGTPVFVRLSDGSSAITTLPVSLASVPSHAVTNVGTFAVQVDGAALTALQLIDDTVFTDDAGFTPGTSKVSVAGFQADETSTDSVDEGDAGAARMTLDRKVIVVPQPHSAGGCTIHRSIDLDEGTLEVVKASPGCVYGMWVANTATSTRFIKFYDATSGTAGTGTPVLTIPIPGNSSDDVGGVFNVGGMGITFATGICVGATTGVADADTGAPGANEVIVNIFFK